ncbi:hypothetical protein AB0H92_47105, partial [Streptomyces phaeochromogenes]|uniref:hypothetical protein n=1 Tax=Streptomyces phaeochromogenes TaxID=1923 RepID=UPI0033E6D82B
MAAGTSWLGARFPAPLKSMGYRLPSGARLRRVGPTSPHRLAARPRRRGAPARRTGRGHVLWRLDELRAEAPHITNVNLFRGWAV